MAISLKSPAQIEAMRRAGALLWEILLGTREEVRPGMTSAELDGRINQAILQAGAEPFMRGYRGQRNDAAPFPGSACICINEEVVHAVAGPRILRPGDIATIDCALRLDGWCADAAVGIVVPGGSAASDGSRESGCYPVPLASSAAMPIARRVEAGARAVVEACIDAAAPGQRWSEVVRVGQAAAAERGLFLLADFAGHGLGRELHEAPAVVFEVPEQTSGAARLDFVLRPGMTFTIEPVLVPEQTEVVGLDDGWTVVTANRSPAAHEERTIAITRGGVRVLTA